MRKLSLLVVSSIALLGLLGIGAQVAYGDPEPDCAGQGVGVKGFHFGTVNPVGGGKGEVYGGAALCGSETELNGIGNYHAKGVYKQGWIVTPGKMSGFPVGQGGVKVTCANPDNDTNGHQQYCDPYTGPYPDANGGDFQKQVFMGNSGVDIINCTGAGGNYGLGQWCSWLDSFSKLWVYKAPKLGVVANPYCKSNTVVQCLSSSDEFGAGYGSITVEPCWVIPESRCRAAAQAQYGITDLDPLHNRYLMTIYPLKALGLGATYYTEIGEPKFNHGSEPDPRDFKLCEYANTANPAQDGCGDSSDPEAWVQANGPAGSYPCNLGGKKPEGELVRAQAVGSIAGTYDACSLINWS